MSPLQRFILPVLVVSALAGTASAVAAQGWIEPDRIPGPQRNGIEKIRSSVTVTIDGRVARVLVEEWFRNNTPAIGEGVYHFPLPGEAVFNQYSLWQGDTELRGEMMDAQQARAIYESIVRRRKDPALIELVDHGLIRARVFPIQPSETRKVTMRYTQVLDRVGDALRLRYAGGPDTVPRAFHVTHENAAAVGDPFSPTHELTTRRDGQRLEMRLNEGRWRGDLEIFLPLSRALVGLSLLTHRPVGEDGFFMLLLSPGRAAERQALPRDLVAVLDISGSMSGEKMVQARRALEQLIATLRQGDRLRLVAFSSAVRRYSSEWIDIGGDASRRATEWVRGLGAEGGTNIAGALEDAFSLRPREGAMGVVVFLTDGVPSVGEQDAERLADRAEQGRGPYRVFAFGIGYDVNTHLLDRLTERARGATQYIAPGGDIEQAVATLAAKLSSPVLTDLALRTDGDVELFDVQPERLPDLFAGDELVVFGRYRNGGGQERTVTITGRRAGRDERFATTALFPAERSGNDYMAPLWAARKAGALSREIRLRGANRETLEELKRLALRYGILTEYTAYLVQEPDMVAQERQERRLLENSAPAPAAAVGASAVARSRQDAGYADLSSRSMVEVTGAAIADSIDRDAVRMRSGINPTRRMGGRLFIQRDRRWVDFRHSDSLRVVRVEPFSSAYVALLRALPELVEPARMGSGVVVAGRRVSVEIGDGGKQTLSGSELTKIVQEFRN